MTLGVWHFWPIRIFLDQSRERFEAKIVWNGSWVLLVPRFRILNVPLDCPNPLFAPCHHQILIGNARSTSHRHNLTPPSPSSLDFDAAQSARERHSPPARCVCALTRKFRFCLVVCCPLHFFSASIPRPFSPPPARAMAKPFERRVCRCAPLQTRPAGSCCGHRRSLFRRASHPAFFCTVVAS